MIYSNEINKNYFLDNLNNQRPIIFDIGSFDGNDSLEFLKLYNEAQIYAFEADKRSIGVFKKNVGSQKISLVEIVLSNVDGTVDFYPSKSATRRHESYNFESDWSASSSISPARYHNKLFPDVQFKKPIKVKSIKLDTWISDKNIDLIDIMWVDVNGGEFEFIEGAIDTLNQKVKYLYIEFTAVNDKKLFEGSMSSLEIKKRLYKFEEVGIYNFQGNFGNILLRNTKL